MVLRLGSCRWRVGLQKGDLQGRMFSRIGVLLSLTDDRETEQRWNFLGRIVLTFIIRLVPWSSNWCCSRRAINVHGVSFSPCPDALFLVSCIPPAKFHCSYLGVHCPEISCPVLVNWTMEGQGDLNIRPMPIWDWIAASCRCLCIWINWYYNLKIWYWNLGYLCGM